MHSFKLITYLIKIVLAEKKHILFLVSNISSVKKMQYDQKNTY